MRLSMISRIIQTKVNVMSQKFAMHEFAKCSKSAEAVWGLNNEYN
jgi:hypothetical protein